MHERVFGLESEYGIIFEPSRPGTRIPSSGDIFPLIERELQTRYTTLPARYRRKRGLFLENGALVTFETVDHMHGLLEVATPECRTARDVTIYSAAIDRMVAHLARAVTLRLESAGFSGRLHFSKAGADGKGHVWGAHENYYVEDPRPLSLARGVGDVVCRAIFTASLSVAFGLSILFFILSIGLLLGYALAALVAFGAMSFGVLLCGLSGRLIKRQWDTHAPIQSLLRGLHAGFDGLFAVLRDAALVIDGRIGPALLRPALRVCERFYERMAWQPFIHGLTSFLVTRPLWCGGGRLWAERPTGREQAQAQPFTLSSRAAVMRRVAGIGIDAEFLFDLKSCLTGPLVMSQRRTRLEIICGDASMSERSTFLRFGLTGLLLRMIEEGERFDALQLADPMASLQAIASDTTLRRLYRLADGRAMSALDIQRCYLERAETFYARSDAVETRELLTTWRRMLAGLETVDGDHEGRELALAGEVDWITRRAVMREMASAAGVPLSELDAAVPLAAEVAQAVGGDPAHCSLTVERDVRQLLERTINAGRMGTIRRTVEYHEWSWLRLLALARLTYEMRRVDLRWHELGDDTEDYARLREAGRMSSDEALDHAERHAPTDTRAHLRGELVRTHAGAGGRRVSLSWSRFRGPSRADDRELADPLDARGRSDG